jgi:hypothetical protein
LSEVEFLVVDGVCERQLQEFQLGEDTLHHGPDEGVHAVVVADVEEATGDEVVAQVLRLLLGEDHVAMAGHVNERVGEQIRAAHFHDGHLGVDGRAQLRVAEFHEVGQRGGVTVPIAAAVVLQHGQLERALCKGR